MGSLESSGAEVRTVDVFAAKDLVDSGYLFLDVRTEEEFENGYPDAGMVHNIPYLFITPEGRVKNLEFMDQASSAYRTKDKIVIGCRSGVRSLDAGIDLVKAGYKQVVNMGGGYLSWVEHSLPVKKPIKAQIDEQAKETVPVQKHEEAGEEQNKNELPVAVEKPTN